MGRFTADPELKRTSNGTAVCSFTLAVDRDGKSSETGKHSTDFIEFVAWRAAAEFICRYFQKGRMAVVEGRLQIRTWKDKYDQNRKNTEVVVDNIYFGDSKREEISRYDDETHTDCDTFSEIGTEDEELPF